MKVKMEVYSRRLMFLVFAFALVSIGYAQESNSTTLVPAILTFGDSVVDVGNNDYLPTIFSVGSMIENQNLRARKKKLEA